VRNTIFADKIVRIKIIGEDFAAFFFIAKLYDRVFPEKMVGSQRRQKGRRTSRLKAKPGADG
jgi:hypothetical protein